MKRLVLTLLPSLIVQTFVCLLLAAANLGSTRVPAALVWMLGIASVIGVAVYAISVRFTFHGCVSAMIVASAGLVGVLPTGIMLASGMSMPMSFLSAVVVGIISGVAMITGCWLGGWLLAHSRLFQRLRAW